MDSSDHSFEKHFDGERFFNPSAPQARGLASVLRWKLTSRPQGSPKFVPDVTPSKPPRRVDGPHLHLTLINHATVLLQTGGLNIVTDPIWSQRAGPLPWLGPRRRRLPGVRREDLPHVDLVLLSHNHYDHLDLPTLRWLAERDRPEFVAPLGVGSLLRSQKIGPVHELDWGQAVVWRGYTVNATPALHFSARGPFDRNKTLWCGYMLNGSVGNIYFAGDTAFGSHFAQIRERFGSPRLAFIPIGAYAPRWFMSPIHMSPGDAFRAHEILGAEISVAIHHGTFKLADEALDAPGEELLEIAHLESFITMANGESLTIER